MTGQDLRDLLRHRVDDLVSTDLPVDVWDRACARRRRRHVVAAVSAALAVVLVAGGLAVGRDRLSDSPTPGPLRTPRTGAPSTPPFAPSRGPDGHDAGRPVYWGPTSSQETTLPGVPSPLPRRIDLSAPAPDLAADPADAALAAFTITEADDTRLLLLLRDGTLRTVDTDRISPLVDGAGHDVSIARATLLSRSGRYLAFPQHGDLQVLDVATDSWHTIDTGTATTEFARWLGDDIWLPPTAQGGGGPIFSATDADTGFDNATAAPGRFGAGAKPYGRWTIAAGGEAQVWTGVEGVPTPHDQSGPAQVLLVGGIGVTGPALLVLGATTDAPRPAGCCEVRFWLDDRTVVYESDGGPRTLVAWRVGTHRFGRVATIEGYDADRATLISSFAAGIDS